MRDTLDTYPGRRLAVALATLPFLLQATHAQGSERGTVTVRSFEPSEYAGHPQVWAIEQADDGIVYCANTDGLLEFDGEQWRGYLHPERRRLVQIALHPDGPIYAGFLGDFGFFWRNAAGGFEYRSVREHMPAGHESIGTVRAMAVCADGVLFANADNAYLWRPEDSSHRAGSVRVLGEPMPGRPPEHSFSAAFAIEGRILLNQKGRGLVALEAEALVPIPGGGGAAELTVVGIDLLDPGVLLISTYEQGLFLYTERSFEPWNCPASDWVRTRRLSGVTALQRGRLAFATAHDGLLLTDRDGELLRVVDEPAGLARHGILGRGSVDVERGLWLPTGYGVTRVDIDSPIESFHEDHGLRGQILAIERHEGTLYVGTTAGVFALRPTDDPTKEAHFQQVEPNEWCASLLSAEGWLLTSTPKSLLAHRNGETQELLPMACRALVRPRGGKRVFAAGRDGVHTFGLVDGAWTELGPQTPTQLVASMVEDDAGRLWVAEMADEGTHRILRVENGVANVYGEQRGLPGLKLLYPFAWEGALYAGGATGLFRYDEEGDRFLPDASLWETAESFVDGRAVVAPHVDERGRLWFVQDSDLTARAERGADGTARLRYPLAKDGHRQFRVFHFEPEQGIVWAGASDGKLVRYDEALEFAPPEQPVLIRALRTDERWTPGEWREPKAVPAELPYLAGRRMRLEYAYPSYWSVADALYQNRLLGLDERWSPWSGETYRDFTALREGSYRFEVRVGSATHGIGDANVLEFRILPPWYRTTWAWIAYSVGGALAIWGLVAWRVGVHRRRVDELAEEIRQRERAEEARSTAEAERRELEQQLRQSQKLEAVGTLATGVAHDFNNLLTAILGYADLAQLAAGDDEELVEYLENLHDIALDAAGVTKGLLTFGRAAEFHKQTVDLATVVADTVRLLQRILPASIELKEEVEGSVRVEGDQTQLMQIVMNLAVNARDAMPDGGELTIRARTQRPGGEGEDGYAVLEVADTGQGMSEDVRERVFLPFFTTKTRERGTGLGLAIVHGIVADHGGSIAIESEPGRGTLVRVLLPLSADVEADVTAAAGDRARPGGRGTVLIAEDDPSIRTLVVRAMRRIGCEPLAASDGEEALELFAARGGELCAVLLDLDLPKRHGTECVEQIRAQRPELPIVVMTGSPLAAREGLVDPSRMLPKPFMMRDLEHLVLEVTS